MELTKEDIETLISAEWKAINDSISVGLLTLDELFERSTRSMRRIERLMAVRADACAGFTIKVVKVAP